MRRGGVWRLVLAVALLIAGAAEYGHAREAIPAAAMQHRAEMTRSALRVFGPSAPVATLAAQIHVESAWRVDARSPVGAMGLAQFMPATAADMARRWPAECAPADPWSPAWAFRCRDRYMRSHLVALRSLGSGLTECARWVFALRAYNGGRGWVERDRRAALDAGLDPDDWRAVASVNAGRSPAAWRENTSYAPKILQVQQRYQAAGWGAGVQCG